MKDTIAELTQPKVLRVASVLSPGKIPTSTLLRPKAYRKSQASWSYIQHLVSASVSSPNLQPILFSLLPVPSRFSITLYTYLLNLTLISTYPGSLSVGTARSKSTSRARRHYRSAAHGQPKGTSMAVSNPDVHTRRDCETGEVDLASGHMVYHQRDSSSGILSSNP